MTALHLDLGNAFTLSVECSVKDLGSANPQINFACVHLQLSFGPPVATDLFWCHTQTPFQTCMKCGAGVTFRLSHLLPRWHRTSPTSRPGDERANQALLPSIITLHTLAWFNVLSETGDTLGHTETCEAVN